MFWGWEAMTVKAIENKSLANKVGTLRMIGHHVILCDVSTRYSPDSCLDLMEKLLTLCNSILSLLGSSWFSTGTAEYGRLVSLMCHFLFASPTPYRWEVSSRKMEEVRRTDYLLRTVLPRNEKAVLWIRTDFQQVLKKGKHFFNAGHLVLCDHVPCCTCHARLPSPTPEHGPLSAWFESWQNVIWCSVSAALW